MADPILTARPLLDGFDVTIGDTRLRELDTLAIVAVAEPQGGKTKLNKALKDAYGTGMPKPGVSVVSKNGKARVVPMQADQCFVLFDHAKPDAEAVVRKAIKDTGYVTDQTDGWVALELSGPLAVPALERICAVDLHDGAFGDNAAARTPMEHMGALVIRVKQDHYLVISASSSAGSFVHAVETSLKYVS